MNNQARKRQALPTVLRMKAEGATLGAIANTVGVPLSTVHNWLRAKPAAPGERARPERIESSVSALSCFELIYREAMDAWQRSKSNSAAAVGGKGDSPMVATTVPVAPAKIGTVPLGDHGFLRAALEALGGMCLIQGLGRPRQGGTVSVNANPVTNLNDDVQGISDESLAAFEANLNARIHAELARAAKSALLHEIHEGGLSAPLASRAAGGIAGAREGGPLPAADGH